jgi:4-aminobutyrate aminotransferase-like enzyme
MGGGVPLSGVIGRAEILDLPDIGNMSSTHSANPLVCAAGIAVLEEIDSRNLVAETARKGDIFFLFLNRIKEKFPLNIDLVLGKGLIAAMTFKDSETGHPDGVTASKVSEKCMQKGLLVVHTGRESIKFGPPLTISDAALAEGLETLSVSIKEILSL